jgi:hypothetical protein
MTADEYLAKLKDPRWYGEQDENGVDLSLIRHNLMLTPEERLLRGDAARRGALSLLRYGRRNAPERPGDSLMQLLAIKRIREEEKQNQKEGK